ncbi:hypothetical protein [Lysobacter sp. CA199]|uniref:hypothetical protein n=1 Tax=Lysobacter sp. CA199 TaxID=3455608 RepID=UPI003F8CF277
MCTGFEIAALAAAAVGTGATVYNTNKTAERQDNALASQLRGQAERQREADAKTSDLIQKTAQSSGEDERANSLDGFLRQIKAQQGAANSGTYQEGAVSESFKKSGADAALGIADYGNKVADLMSRIDAPRQQRVNEAVDSVRFGNEIDQIKRVGAGEDFLAQLRLRGVKRDPWIDLAAGVAQGAGSAYAGRGASTGGSAGSKTAFGNNFDNFRWSQ